MKNRPSVRMTGPRTLRFSSGRMRPRWIAAPASIINPTMASSESQTFHRCSTVSTKMRKVENIAISPCAKFRWPVVL
jgi:hypothetical protein